MTLSKIADHLNGAAPQPQDQGGGYSPENTHPMMVRSDLKGGSYDAYMGMVRSMADREMRTLGAYVQSGWYRNPKLKRLVHRYYGLAQWQITSPAGLMNHRRASLIQERASLQGMLERLEDPADPADGFQLPAGQLMAVLQHSEDDAKKMHGSLWVLPLTLQECYGRLEEITDVIRRLAYQIRDAQRQGRYVDCGPLLEYFRTPYKERGDIDLLAIAPPFLLKLQAYVDISIAEIWRHQAQRIVSQTADGEDYSKPQESEAPPKRSLLGRVRGQ